MAAIHPHSEYYLHTNGDIIYKPHGGVELDSPFVVKSWNVNRLAESPDTFLEWLKEVKSLGGNENRIRDLIEHNNLRNYIPDCYFQLGLIE